MYKLNFKFLIPLLCYLLLTTTGCAEYKQPKEVVGYGGELIKRFFDEYKKLPKEAFEKKYPIKLDHFPILNKTYKKYNVRLLKWFKMGDSISQLTMDYKVDLITNTSKSSYIFTLFFSVGFITEGITENDLTDLRNWVITWSQEG